jgi:hypothetical protein
MMNRSMLVNVTDDDTSKNSKSFGLLEPVPMEIMEMVERPIRNLRMELENLPNLGDVNVVTDNEFNAQNWDDVYDGLIDHNQYPNNRA